MLFCLITVAFVVLSGVWENYASCFVFSLRITLVILGLVWFHINFWIIYASSLKNIMDTLIGIASNQEIALGSIAI